MSHYCARELAKFGHTVKLMHPGAALVGSGPARRDWRDGKNVLDAG
jgi:hypothetical protein